MPGGVLTVSRWYYPSARRGHRACSRSRRSPLRRAGSRDPRQHIVIVRCDVRAPTWTARRASARILVSPSPFSAGEIRRCEQVAARLGFEVVLDAGRLPRPIRPSTADRQRARLRALVRRLSARHLAADGRQAVLLPHAALARLFDRVVATSGARSFNLRRVSVLGVLLARRRCADGAVHPRPPGAALGAAAPPTRAGAASGVLRGDRLRLHVRRDLADAAADRLSGHPTYGLSVVLFTLLSVERASAAR